MRYQTRQVLVKGLILAHDSNMKMHYFDWAATAPISKKALDTYNQITLEYYGNPSSLHQEGQKAAKRLAQEREKTAALLQVSPSQIYYTAGATESNSIVLNSLLWKRKPGRIIVSTLEHSSILQYRHFLETKGFEVVSIKAPGGFVDLQALEAALTDNTQMVSIMLVSNLLGTVQDISAIAQLLRQQPHRIHFHCDAVQAIGKIPFNLDRLDVDSASFSAHKFQGPRGTGLLYQRGNTIQPLSRGGGQEQGLRGGTEHLAAIAAMNQALEETLFDMEHKMVQGNHLRTILEQELRAYPFVTLLSPPIDSGLSATPFIVTIAVEHFPSEVFTRILFDKGFCVSSGSACANNSPHKNEGPLQNAGFSSTLGSSAIRISFSNHTTAEEIKKLAQTIGEESKTLGLHKRK